MTTSGLSVLSVVCLLSSATMAETSRESFEQRQHRTDSLTILMLLGLLLLTILTVWLFKHRRFRFVHETGLSMIYGLIVGAIIRYTSEGKPPPPTQAMLIGNRTNGSTDPPDYVAIDFNLTSNTAQRVIYVVKKSMVGFEEQALERTVTFSPELFFNVMLPVIIFEAGYSMKRKHFFKNLGAILMYALIGTTISALVFGGIIYGLTRLMSEIKSVISLNECFIFGAYMSATDPVTVLALFSDLHVDVDLYALVFGESVLNDAVAIVLSESVETYGELSSDSFNLEAFFSAVGKFVGVFTAAFAIGTFMGVITALMTKFTKVRDFPLLETALFFLMSYSTFQAAEAADLTGIVAVLFCGITQAHYTYNNLSVESKHRTKQLFELMNFLSENFVFLYVGVSIFTFEPIKWDPGFIFASFLAVFVARMCNIYPMSFLLNLGRSNKIRPNFQHMMMFSGLRGAMAFALAIRDTDTPGKQLIVSATMTIVLSTVILCGGFTTPMLQWLQIRVGVEENETELRHVAGDMRNGPRAGRELTSQAVPLLDQVPSLQPGSLSSSRVSEKAWLVAKWYNFDMMFMKPLLTNCRPTLLETMPKCCLPFAKLFTTEEQISQGEVHFDDDSDTDNILGAGNGSMSDDVSSVGEVVSRRGADPSMPVTSSSWMPKEPLQMEEILVSESDDMPLTP